MRKPVALALIIVAGVTLIAFTFIPASSKPVTTVLTPTAMYAGGNVHLCSSGAAFTVVAQNGNIRRARTGVLNKVKTSDGIKAIPATRNCVEYQAPATAGEDHLTITEGENVFRKTVTIYEDEF